MAVDRGERAGLTVPEARAVVRRAYPGAEVDRVLLRAGGESSAVYEVRSRGSVPAVIVKVYPERLSWQMAKERYVYGLLAGQPGVVAPRVLLVDDSREVLAWNYAVLTVVDGVPVGEVGRLRGVGGLFREIGAQLAAIHRVVLGAYGYIVTGVIEPAGTNHAHMTGRFAAKVREFRELGGDRELGGAVERYVAAHEELFRACERAVLCHNDYHAGNVLIVRDGRGWRLSGVIDVENAVSADPVLDLAKTDYYWIGASAGRRKAFLEGYGGMPAGWPDALPLYRLFHALELWNWYKQIDKPGPLRGLAEDMRALTR